MELAIFPLNGAVLFPGTSLPLNIFEARYIEMINYALARDRKIGMIQTNENNELFNIGCVGKIHSFNETNDGRYLISLQGVNCFKVINEVEQKYSFRIVNIGLIKNDDAPTDKDYLILLYIEGENVKERLKNPICLDDKTDIGSPKNFKPKNIFEASDYIIDRLAIMFDKERKLKK